MFSLLRLDSADTTVKQHDLLVKTRVESKTSSVLVIRSQTLESWK